MNKKGVLNSMLDGVEKVAGGSLLLKRLADSVLSVVLPNVSAKAVCGTDWWYEYHGSDCNQRCMLGTAGQIVYQYYCCYDNQLHKTTCHQTGRTWLVCC